jgi:hypothetical protein
MKRITDKEFESIKMVYHNILMAYSDHEYLTVHKLDIIKAAFIDQNQTFFKRLIYYLFHFTIVELNKVFNNPETYSLSKYINSELKELSESHPDRNKIILLKNEINSEKTKNILKKIKTIRDKFSAHLDSDRNELENYKILVSDVEYLLNILEKFVQVFHQLIKDKEYINPISKEILGYKLHEQFAKTIIKS